MSTIPKQRLDSKSKIVQPNIPDTSSKVVFSFKAIDKNEYFNLDSVCESWSNYLFDMMKTISNIDVKDIYAGKFSDKRSPLRIHQHSNASAPCKVPEKINLEDMWQIRIARNKGGIHGCFVENVFYVVWFDPHHNLYPSDSYGGLKKIVPPTLCCEDCNGKLQKLNQEILKSQEEARFWEEQAKELEKRLALLT